MTSSHTTAESVPYHLGIIPDGNRRWAKAKGRPSLKGHQAGMEASRRVALAAFDRGVKYMTMYAFSTENWKRTQEEVGYLMDIFHKFLLNEYREFDDRGVRFQLIGRRDGLSRKFQDTVKKIEERTASYPNGTLAWCLNYGGQLEIADAAAALISEGVSPAEVTPELLAGKLYEPEIPPLDLIIRSSGEKRLSGFMLWRAAYAELYFVDQHWPDFTVEDLDAALAEYAGRQRRFGA
jgi:undecaprenyl diphosphate synthase